MLTCFHQMSGCAAIPQMLDLKMRVIMLNLLPGDVTTEFYCPTAGKGFRNPLGIGILHKLNWLIAGALALGLLYMPVARKVLQGAAEKYDKPVPIVDPRFGIEKVPYIYAYSPSLLAKPADWPKNAQVVGSFCVLLRKGDPEPNALDMTPPPAINNLSSPRGKKAPPKIGASPAGDARRTRSEQPTSKAAALQDRDAELGGELKAGRAEAGGAIAAAAATAAASPPPAPSAVASGADAVAPRRVTSGAESLSGLAGAEASENGSVASPRRSAGDLAGLGAEPTIPETVAVNGLQVRSRERARLRRGRPAGGCTAKGRAHPRGGLVCLSPPQSVLGAPRPSHPSSRPRSPFDPFPLSASSRRHSRGPASSHPCILAF